MGIKKAKNVHLAYASSSGSIGLTTKRSEICVKWHNPQNIFLPSISI